MSIQLYKYELRAGTPGGPLVFAFHGTGGDESQLVPLAAQLVPSATVISPRGDVSEAGALRFFRRTGEGVYDMADLAQRTEAMGRFVAAHAERHAARPVIGIGYSNGANILASLIFRQPELFDAAVLMHPLIPFRPQIDGSLGKARLLITAGRRDPICPPPLTEALAKALQAAGAKVELAWHDGGHELRPSEVDAAAAFLAALAKSRTQEA